MGVAAYAISDTLGKPRDFRKWKQLELGECTHSLGGGWYIFRCTITLQQGGVYHGTIEGNRKDVRIKTFKLYDPDRRKSTKRGR